MPEGRDDKAVRIISELSVKVDAVQRNMEQASRHVHQHSKKIVDETKQATQEANKAWDKWEKEQERVLKQSERMWEQHSRKMQQIERERNKRTTAEVAEFERQERERASAAERRAQQSIVRDRKVRFDAERKAQNDRLSDERRVQSEVESMWRERASEDARISKEVATMHEQKAREDAKRDAERTRHIQDANRNIATEERRQARMTLNEAKKDAIERIKVARQVATEEKRNSRLGVVLPGQAMAEVANVQSQMRYAQIHNSLLKQQAATIREKIAVIQKEYELTGKLTTEQVEQLNNLRAQTRAMSTLVSRMQADDRGTFLGNLKSMLARRAEWLMAGTLMYGTWNAAVAGVNDVSDIEQRMVQLRRVMEDPLFDMKEMQKEIFNLSQEFGFSFQQTHEIMLRWAQAGYNVADSIEATRSSLLALNNAELDAEQSTQAMIGILTQWEMGAGELESVIDRVNKTADSFSVTSQDIVDALLRSSGAAKNAGMTLNQLIAIITATKTATSRAGKEIGNALNSIFNFFSREKAQKMFAENGIAVFADEAGTKLRPVFDLMKDMAENWDGFGVEMQQRFMEDAESLGLLTEEMAEAGGALTEWTDLQKRDLLTAGAQSYRRNYLIGLLRNFSQVYDVLAVQERAAGYTQRENAAAMETYAKKSQQLKTALQELVLSFAQEGGILDMLKNIVSGTKTAIEAYNNLSSSSKSLITRSLELAVVLGTVSYAMKSMTGLGIVGTTKMLFSKEAWTGLVASIRGAVTAMGGLGAAVGTIAAVALPLATLAVMYTRINNEAYRLQNTYEETKRKSQELIDVTSKEAKLHADNALMVKSLAEEYRKLDAQKVGASGGTLDAIAVKQEQIVARVEDALGRETAARLKAAGFSEDAANLVMRAESEKAKRINEEVDKQVEAYRKSLREQADVAAKSIEVIAKGLEGWDTYFGFMERVEMVWKTFWMDMKKGYYDTLDWIATAMMNFNNKMAEVWESIPGLSKTSTVKEWAREAREAAESAGRAASEYREKAADIYQEEAKYLEGKLDAKATEHRKLYLDLLKELELLGGGTGGKGDGTDGKFPQKTGDADAIKASAVAIVDKVEALRALAEATESEMSLLKTRIDYNSRERASIDELTQADTDRARVLELITQRQGELANIAMVSRNSIDALRAAQASLNRSTEEGNSAWEDLENKINSLIKLSGTNTKPFGELSEQWWSLEKDKVGLLEENNAATVTALRNLKEMKEQYEKGVLPLDKYVSALARLETQAGLTDSALNEINIEQSSALLKQWTRDLEDEITKGDNALKSFGETLDNIFDDVSTAGKRADASVMMNALRNSLGSLGGGYGAATNTYDAAKLSAKSLIGDILGGKFTVDANALMKLDREQFVSAVSSAKGDLMGAATEVNTLLINLANERDAVIRSIEAQINPINDVLARFDKLNKTDAAKELRDAMNSSLGRLNGVEAAIPGMPTLKQLKDLVGAVKVTDLGALSPDTFASVLKENMTSLRGMTTTAKTYLEGVTKGFEKQIDEIDTQIRKVDDDLKTRLGELQKQLDEMDAEDKQAERNKEKADMDARRKSVDNELAWRLEREDLYVFEIAALRKEKAELDREWAEKGLEWERDDKRESIQTEMEKERAKASERKEALEEQKRGIERQRELWQEALNDVLKYIDGEINGLREIAQERVYNLNAQKQAKSDEYALLLEALGNVQTYVRDVLSEWQRLADERKRIEDELWNDEKGGIKKLIENGMLGVLALMTATGATSGQAYVDAIISGVNSRKDALQAALNALAVTTGTYQNSQQQTTTPVGGGTGGGVTRPGGGRLMMANEGYVTARPGGYDVKIGEGGVDEAVVRVDRLQPKIDHAFLVAAKKFGTTGMGVGVSARDIANAVGEALSKANFYAVVDSTLPSGEVQREIVKFIMGSSLGQSVRAM